MGVSPLIDLENGLDVSPLPSEASGVAVLSPNALLHVPGLVVLYLNQPFVDAPLGAPAPLSVAVVILTPVAGVVVAVGLSDATKSFTPP